MIGLALDRCRILLTSDFPPRFVSQLLAGKRAVSMAPVAARTDEKLDPAPAADDRDPAHLGPQLIVPLLCKMR